MYQPTEPQYFIVESRVRKLESLLANTLETFRLNQDVIILGIPQQVRGLTMREFGTKYNGDIHAAARGVQREKLGDLAQTNDIDKTTRKRIWLESQEAEAERSGHASPSRTAKKGMSETLFCARFLGAKWLYQQHGRNKLSPPPRR